MEAGAPGGGLPPLEAADRTRTGPLAGPGPGRGLASNRPLRVRRPAPPRPPWARAPLPAAPLRAHGHFP